ncbi:MAG: hypothetical protein ACKVQK_04280 [Burkholderiales bacterium]
MSTTIRLFLPAALAFFLGSVPPGLHAQTESPCAKAVPAGAKCYSGKQAQGGYYLIVIPQNWNKVLVMHAHGGPDLADPTPVRSEEDITRWSIMVRAGYAWAGSTFRRGGYGVTMAAEDTENLRQFFIKTFGQPRRTIMHGQSWGGNVGAKTVELFGKTVNGVKNYDGALLTSGVLGGGTRGYDYRIDLRVVYQHYCNNHPRPNEAQYPLWMGLPADSKMTTTDMRARVNECTGVLAPREKRSATQQRNLDNILNVLRMPEQTLVSHMSWATFLFADMVHKRLGGRNPFSTTGVRYAGSDDDAALNKGVARYLPDAKALADLARDADLTGKVSIPVLTMHALNDPTAFVEHEDYFRRVYERAGSAALLVQTFTYENEHSYLSTPAYPALMTALLDWIDNGKKPNSRQIAALCEQNRSIYGESCRFAVDYRPQAYEDRVYPRQR